MPTPRSYGRSCPLSLERRLSGDVDWEAAGDVQIEGPPDVRERMLRVTGLA